MPGIGLAPAQALSDLKFLLYIHERGFRLVYRSAGPCRRARRNLSLRAATCPSIRRYVPTESSPGRAAATRFFAPPQRLCAPARECVAESRKKKADRRSKSGLETRSPGSSRHPQLPSPLQRSRGYPQFAVRVRCQWQGRSRPFSASAVPGPCLPGPCLSTGQPVNSCRPAPTPPAACGGNGHEWPSSRQPARRSECR